jgi:LacI family transcriptional regulator
MATLRQVAERAGVSIKTVSRIVNGDESVTAKTRERVQQHLNALNYVPDHAARMMRGGDSRVIGFLTDAVATTPYSVDIVRGAQSALRDLGKTLLIANTERDEILEQDYWRMFGAHRVGGVIYASMFHRPIELGKPPFDKPIVLANGFAVRGDRPSLIPGDEDGGYAQAAYLLKLGHRRIGIVSLIPQIEATRLRGIGIRRAFQDAGVSFDESLDQIGMVGEVYRERMVAFDVAYKMLGAKNRPTAIICGNDQVALQIYAAAARHNLHIPDDLSVMGFDDQTVISENMYPALTTVALPYFEIGRLAVAMLQDIKTKEQGWAPKILVPCPLVERASCRPMG